MSETCCAAEITMLIEVIGGNVHTFRHKYQNVCTHEIFSCFNLELILAPSFSLYFSTPVWRTLHYSKYFYAQVQLYGGFCTRFQRAVTCRWVYVATVSSAALFQ